MTDRYSFSTATDKIDRDLVHRWLSEQSYWARGRSRETQDAAIDASRNYAVYDADTGEQVAYARLVTDAVTFGWLCDVFVPPEARGQGLGKMLIEGVVADLDILGLRRTLLSTGDAHGFYRQYDFGALDEPSKIMTRVR